MDTHNDIVKKLGTTGRGTTYFFTIPQHIIKELKWKKGEKKVVKREGSRIVIEDWTP